MFSWFRKEKAQIISEKRECNDSMEESLWEIKEVYDLETEEVARVVDEKRNYAEKIKLRTKKY